MKLLQSILFSLLMGVAVAAYAVSDEVKVDLLMAKITSALKADRAADALPFFAELEGMESTLKNPLPESFHFYYIDTLDKTGDKAKALSRADIYLNKYGKNGKYYGQVIEIMGRLQMQIEKDGKDAAERKRAYKLEYDIWKKYQDECVSKLEEKNKLDGTMKYEDADERNREVRRIIKMQNTEYLPGWWGYAGYCRKQHPEPIEPK